MQAHRALRPSGGCGRAASKRPVNDSATPAGAACRAPTVYRRGVSYFVILQGYDMSWPPHAHINHQVCLQPAAPTHGYSMLWPYNKNRKHGGNTTSGCAAIPVGPRTRQPTGVPTTNSAGTRPQHAVALQQKQKTRWQYHLRLRCDTRRATTCRGRKVDAQAVAAPGGLPARY